MTIDASILDDIAARSARLVALSLMEDLVRERERLAVARDSETLHDFRVSLRRDVVEDDAADPHVRVERAKPERRRTNAAGRLAHSFLSGRVGSCAACPHHPS